MHLFSILCKEINHLGEEKQLHQRLVSFLKNSEDEEIACAIKLLYGNRPRRICTLEFLENSILEFFDIPGWLFERSKSISGEVCETCSLIIPIPEKIDKTPLSKWLTWIQEIARVDEKNKRKAIYNGWKKLFPESRWIIGKLLTGTFRVKLSPVIISNALAEHLSLNPNQIARKLNEFCETEVQDLKTFFNEDNEVYDLSPFPFLPVSKGSIENFTDHQLTRWLTEYDWDGIRCQIKFGNHEMAIWGINGELLNDKLPEFKILLNDVLAGTCLEGIIVSVMNDKISPRTHLSNRLRRKQINKKTQEQFPILFIAYDLLEIDFVDFRQKTLESRRIKLEELIEGLGSDLISLSDEIELKNWDQVKLEINKSRLLGAGGMLLKERQSKYNPEENWHQILADSFKMKGVLIYATRGEGGRAAGYAELSLAAKFADSLMPVVKAPYEPQDEQESDFLNQFIKEHTIERFGPVASLEAELVFHFEFDDIIHSKQRKCGFILKNPRITGLDRDMDKGMISLHEDFLNLIK